MNILRPSLSFHPAEDRLYLKAVSDMCKPVKWIQLDLNSGPLTQPTNLINKKDLYSMLQGKKSAFTSVDVSSSKDWHWLYKLYHRQIIY